MAHRFGRSFQASFSQFNRRMRALSNDALRTPEDEWDRWDRRKPFLSHARAWREYGFVVSHLSHVSDPSILARMKVRD